MEKQIDEIAQFAKYVEENLTKDECHKIFGYDKYDHYYNKLANNGHNFIYFFLALDQRNQKKLYLWYAQIECNNNLVSIFSIDTFFKYLLSYVGPYKFFDFMDAGRVRQLLRNNYDYPNLWRNCNREEKEKYIGLLDNFNF